jgi:hypothetical protein
MTIWQLLLPLVGSPFSLHLWGALAGTRPTRPANLLKWGPAGTRFVMTTSHDSQAWASNRPWGKPGTTFLVPEFLPTGLLMLEIKEGTLGKVFVNT